MRRILAFAAIVEAGTGLVLMIHPAIALAWLVGPNPPPEGMPLGRVFGVALLALGVACWPARQRVESGSTTVLALLIYNVLVAPYLLYLGATGSWTGLLLWPAVGLHVLVALSLAWTWRAERP